jgi:glycine/D-amino acid oxidase-like deaminating enzyme
MAYRPRLPNSLPVTERAAAHPGLVIACGQRHTN